MTSFTAVVSTLFYFFVIILSELVYISIMYNSNTFIVYTIVFYPHKYNVCLSNTTCINNYLCNNNIDNLILIDNQLAIVNTLKKKLLLNQVNWH